MPYAFASNTLTSSFSPSISNGEEGERKGEKEVSERLAGTDAGASTRNDDSNEEMLCVCMCVERKEPGGGKK